MVELVACDLMEELSPVFRQMAENSTRESDDRSVAATATRELRQLRIYDSEGIQLQITDNGTEVQVWVEPPFYASEDVELLIEVMDASQTEAMGLKDKLDKCVA
jgi:hypothetical protein